MLATVNQGPISLIRRGGSVLFFFVGLGCANKPCEMDLLVTLVGPKLGVDSYDAELKFVPEWQVDDTMFIPDCNTHDGRLESQRWEIVGDGSVTPNEGSNTARVVLQGPGERTVSVKLADNWGNTATGALQLRVLTQPSAADLLMSVESRLAFSDVHGNCEVCFVASTQLATGLTLDSIRLDTERENPAVWAQPTLTFESQTVGCVALHDGYMYNDRFYSTLSLSDASIPGAAVSGYPTGPKPCSGELSP